MLFCSSRHANKDRKLNIICNNASVEHVTEMKYLGIILDPHLSFKAHILKINKKVKQRTGLLWHVRSFIDYINLAKQLYVSLIGPLFSYCDYIYDGCNVTDSKMLQVSQNKALRAVLGVKSGFSATRVHQETEVEWLDIDRIKSTCTQVYKTINGLNPPTMSNLFKQQDQTRNLRSQNKCCITRPVTKTVLGDNNMSVRGYHYWTELSADIKNCTTFASFKRNIKRYNGFKHVK